MTPAPHPGRLPVGARAIASPHRPAPRALSHSPQRGRGALRADEVGWDLGPCRTHILASSLEPRLIWIKAANHLALFWLRALAVGRCSPERAR
jgi:hypothetical protein